MKLLTIVGARPQFIKAAVLGRAIRKYNSGARETGGGTLIREEIIHTGQHYDYQMSQVFFDDMGIPKPTANLNIGSSKNSWHSSPGAMTGEMLGGIEREILDREPDCVLVFGDTNSTLAGALAAAKLNVPVVHVEAGERSFNRTMPEEINRVVTDHLSSVLFCSSRKSCDQLRSEGINAPIFKVGDVMYDAFLTYGEGAKWPAEVERPHGEFVLATVHRAQNTDDPGRLRSILAALDEMNCPVLLPLHPRTLSAAKSHEIRPGDSVVILPPLSYLSMLALLRACRFVVTDSGGLQREAFYAGKKSIILREETEWNDLVSLSAARLVGSDKGRIKEAVSWASTPFSNLLSPYGSGNSAEEIVRILASRFQVEAVSPQEPLSWST